jgi:tetratricopeptide (TPR) repeat protein
MTRAALLYGTVLVALAAVAAALGRRPRAAGGAPAPPRWQGALTLALVGAAVPVIVSTNLDASRASVLVKLAWPLQTAGAWDESIGVLREAVGRAPRDPPYRLALAHALVAKAHALGGDVALREALLGEALAVVSRANAASPGDGEVHHALATLHAVWARLAGDLATRQGHLERAVFHRARALALSPRAAAAWSLRARVLLGYGRVHEAVEAARQATGLDPGLASARGVLAGAQARLGQREAARSAALTAATVASPLDRPAREALPVVLHRTPGGPGPDGALTGPAAPAGALPARGTP